MRSLLFLHSSRSLAHSQGTGKGKLCASSTAKRTIIPNRSLCSTQKTSILIFGCEHRKRLEIYKTAAITIAANMFMPLAAQTATCDSMAIKDMSCQFKPAQLILPASLVTIGSIGVCNGWFHSVNTDIKDGMGEWRKEQYVKVDDYLQYLPVTANICLPIAGLKARHPLKERIAVTATAYLAMGIMVNATKRAVGEKRPDSNARNSFPSGHTATAFMGAELVRKEYGTTIGICAYTVATGVAVLRMYNNRHWLNDIIAGAGMGIISAKIGFWLLPWEKRILGWDKNNEANILLPTIDMQNKAVALTFSKSF